MHRPSAGLAIKVILRMQRLALLQTHRSRAQAVRIQQGLQTRPQLSLRKVSESGSTGGASSRPPPGATLRLVRSTSCCAASFVGHTRCYHMVVCRDPLQGAG